MDSSGVKDNNPGPSWSAYPSFDNRPTDLELLVEDCTFHVHKDILEQSCDYFKAMFQSHMLEQTKCEIKLHSVQCVPFRVLLEAFYTEDLNFDTNMFAVAETMQMLQVKETLQIQCTDYFAQTLDHDNCFEVLFFAEQYSIQDIYNEARRFSLAYFIEIWHYPSFCKLTLEQLMNYLSDDYLCVDHEAEVLLALRKWLQLNPDHLNQSAEIISTCVRLKDNPKALAVATEAVISTDALLFKSGVPDIFESRPRQESILMFWSLLTSTQASGLVDVIKFCPTTSQCALHDSMRVVLELPGFDVGSALCTRGPYVYLSGGGPGFGKVNWIRKLWRFDCTRQRDRWQDVGELIETRRHHAMVAIGNKLYLFGGFGKFRVKNCELDCFDLDRGSWQRLQQTPTHEIKPVTAVHHNTFFYIDAAWNIHAFNTDSENWCTIDTDLPLTSTPVPPISMQILSGHPSNCFVVLSQDERLHLCAFGMSSSDQSDMPVHKDSLECQGKFRHSVVESNKLLIFLEQKGEDFTEESGEEESCLVIKSYDMREKTFSEGVTVKNVRKAQNVVTVPELPQSFRIGAQC